MIIFDTSCLTNRIGQPWSIHSLLRLLPSMIFPAETHCALQLWPTRPATTVGILAKRNSPVGHRYEVPPANTICRETYASNSRQPLAPCGFPEIIPPCFGLAPKHSY